nr:TIGR04013 family B12-binding domain/radical SAM domain-containing protein [Propionibacterium sp.]
MRAAFVVADGTKARYGITACLGALDALPAGRAPEVVWPGAGPDAATLAAAITAVARRGLAPVVLWSAFSPGFDAVAGRLRAVRALTPGGVPARHVVGGPHATADPADAAGAGFDFVAPGEGEWTMRALAAALESGSPLEEVEGLLRPDAAGAVPRGRGRPVEDLDEFGSFALRERRIGPIEITRGCRYACAFCQTPYAARARFRHRSVGSVVAHVRAMLGFGKRQVRFLTPSALSYGASGTDPDLDAVERLLRAVRAELPADGRLYFGTFPSELRPEHVTPDALALVRRYADNDNVIVGGQSGSDAVLAAAHRGHDVAAVRVAVGHCLAAGLVPNVDFIFGMPGETDADVAATLELIRELADAGARVHTHAFLPLPGTPWRDRPPGVVAPEVRAELVRLTSRGRAYGNWERQEGVARSLAEARAGRAGTGR